MNIIKALKLINKDNIYNSTIEANLKLLEECHKLKKEILRLKTIPKCKHYFIFSHSETFYTGEGTNSKQFDVSVCIKCGKIVRNKF